MDLGRVVIEPVKHDWPQVISDLVNVGITIHTISKMMRRQYIQIQRWSEGVQPKHYEGEMLLAIHASYVPRETLQTEAAHSQNTVESV